jgi:hypothetical protein
MPRGIVDLWRKRGLPLSPEGFRCVKGTYSQFGEDAVLAWLFDAEDRSGRYLDLGCFHPARWSNTYHFYLRGWRGMTVDASARHREEWRRLRPGDIHRVAAVVPSPEDRDVVLRENPDFPAASRVESGGEGGAAGEVLAVAEMEKWWPWETAPDLVSIDLEGWDRAVVMRYPFARFGPRVLVAELGEMPEGDPCATHLGDAGYRLAAKIGLSWIWQRAAVEPERTGAR